MSKSKKIPVHLRYEKSGDLIKVINDFIELMEEVTNGDVDVDIDMMGKITIYFEGDSKPKVEKRPDKYGLENLLYRYDEQ